MYYPLSTVGYMAIASMSLIFGFIQFLFIYALDNKFKNYYYTDIPSETIKNKNELAEDDYKIITGDVSIDKSGLTIYSEELDCEWFYGRKKNKLLGKGGKLIIDNLAVDNDTCVITVTRSTGDNSMWISTNGEWCVDTKTSFGI